MREEIREVFLGKESLSLYMYVAAVAVPLAILIALIGDDNIVIYIAQHRNPYLNAFFSAYTDYGNYAVMLALIAFLVASFATERLKEYRPLTLSILISAIVVNLVVVRSIKVAVNRTRPHCKLNLEYIGAYPGCGMSFPSGHTSEAFTYATPLIAKFRERIATIALLAYASLMGFSRVYAAVHYPSDVLAGAVIAVVLSYWIYRFCELKAEVIKESRAVRIGAFVTLILAIIALIALI